jgi:hypothetical protein
MTWKGTHVRALNRTIFALTVAALLTAITNSPSDAARRAPIRSFYDGTWSVAIYTLRGDCGSIRAALRIIGGRVPGTQAIKHTVRLEAGAQSA